MRLSASQRVKYISNDGTYAENIFSDKLHSSYVLMCTFGRFCSLADLGVNSSNRKC